MEVRVVEKVHVDLLVAVAMAGPRERYGRGDGLVWWKIPSLELRARSREIFLETDDEEAYMTFVLDQLREIGVVGSDEVGQMLVNENVRSVLHCYPEAITSGHVPGPVDDYWEQPYRFKPPRRVLGAVEALKATRGYVFQSSSHDAWETSEAKEFCDSLTQNLIGCLPGFYEAPGLWEEHHLTDGGAGSRGRKEWRCGQAAGK